MTQTKGKVIIRPLTKKRSEKKEAGRPVTNMLKLQENMNRLAKRSVPARSDTR
jgi:hypothetical protein